VRREIQRNFRRERKNKRAEIAPAGPGEKIPSYSAERKDVLGILTNFVWKKIPTGCCKPFKRGGKRLERRGNAPRRHLSAGDQVISAKRGEKKTIKTAVDKGRSGKV